MNIFISSIAEYHQASTDILYRLQQFINASSSKSAVVDKNAYNITIYLNPLTELVSDNDYVDYELFTAIRMCRLEGLDITVIIYNSWIQTNHIRWILQCTKRLSKLTAGYLRIYLPETRAGNIEEYNKNVDEFINTISSDYLEDQSTRDFYPVDVIGLFESQLKNNESIGLKLVESGFIKLV